MRADMFSSVGHYWLLIDNAPQGPFDAATVKAKLATGEINPQTMACLLGSHGWFPVAQVLSRSPAAPAASLREQLGWLTFVLTLMFALCLTLILVALAWFRLAPSNGFIGFLGCGLPTMLGGVATYNIWDKKPPLKTLGWTALVYAVINGFCLLVAVLSLVLFSPQWPDPMIQALICFGLTMIVSGGFAVFVIGESDSSKKRDPWSTGTS